MATSTTAAQRIHTTRQPQQQSPGGAWHDRAPKRVRQAYRCEKPGRGWAAWRKHLARRRFRAFEALLPGKRSALTWALVAGAEVDRAVRLIELLRPRGAAKNSGSPGLDNAAACWLSGAEIAPLDVAFSLECLAWCGALPRLAAALSERLWWSLAGRLVAVAGDRNRAPRDPLAMQLAWGELPLALAHAFPELKACHDLAAMGRRTIEEGAKKLCDGAGLVESKHLRLLRPLLACWTRARAVAGELDDGAWSEAADEQYRGLVQHVLRLSREDGRQVFTAPNSRKLPAALVDAALVLADDRQTDRVARLVAGRGKPARQGRGKKIPSPAFQGEWAGIAQLRTDWMRSAPRLTVDFAGRRVESELSTGGKCLWSGSWALDVRFNGRPLEALGNWQQVCWESNDDVDYLELSLRLSEEVTVERQMLLARRDRFLFLGDAILGIQQGAIEYRATLPLAGWSAFEGEAETWEGWLVPGKRKRVRVAPLALNEWRRGLSRGRLHASDGCLELAQSAEAQCLFAPLFVDLDPARAGKEITWRQLTVGQDREAVPVDVAAGYRVQVGKSQWLIYRSLSPPAVRTVLAKNLMHGFLIGKLQSDGTVATLLEIE